MDKAEFLLFVILFRENPEKLKLTKVLTEAVKCAQALKTDELIADTRVKEAFAELVNEVYPRLPESLQDQLLVDFKLNILRRAQEKNTPAELMDGEQKKNFLRKKGARTNTLWIIEKLVLLVGGEMNICTWGFSCFGQGQQQSFRAAQVWALLWWHVEFAWLESGKIVLEIKLSHLNLRCYIQSSDIDVTWVHFRIFSGWSYIRRHIPRKIIIILEGICLIMVMPEVGFRSRKKLYPRKKLMGLTRFENNVVAMVYLTVDVQRKVLSCF
ncbi:unnamed protein product [Triticum turgidum subsp. durum]|uniref:Uncharacterized protein n=1 Tax=Triticum turgidum subsp. durum TaxID=4567 RepID=A0A9R1P8V3_TRITD|nr:unnamed protein product [Triticum turgidum subsp. durum]